MIESLDESVFWLKLAMVALGVKIVCIVLLTILQVMQVMEER